MHRTDPKELLSQGYLVYPHIEQLADGRLHQSLSIVQPSVVDTTHPANRVTVLSANRSWMEFLRNYGKSENNITLPKNTNFPLPEELLKYVTETWNLLKKKWPYEAQFVESCIYSEETALYSLWPFVEQYGLAQVSFLVPPVPDVAGIVVRFPSPASLYPRPPKENAEPSDYSDRS